MFFDTKEDDALKNVTIKDHNELSIGPSLEVHELKLNKNYMNI